MTILSLGDRLGKSVIVHSLGSVICTCDWKLFEIIIHFKNSNAVNRMFKYNIYRMQSPINFMYAIWNDLSSNFEFSFAA